MGSCSPLRVLCVTGGGDRVEMGLFVGLAEQKVAIEVVGEAGGLLEELMARHSIPFHDIPLTGRLSPYGAYRLRALMRRGFHVVHAFTNRALSNSLIASMGLPILRVAYRGTAGNVQRSNPGSWLTYLNPKLHALICVSDAVKEYLLSVGIPAQKLFTVHKGHDPEWYSEWQPHDLGSLGIPRESFVVSCVANMRPVKGVDTLLRALTLLAQNPKIHTLIIGEMRDSTVQRIVESSPARDRIHLLGYRRDALSFVKSSQLFVMPSREREGLPKALIEAMLHSVPAVVTAVGGMPEVVRHEREGLIVSPDDPEALAAAIQRLADNPDECARYAAAAHTRVMSDFHIQKTVRETISVYESLVESALLEPRALPYTLIKQHTACSPLIRNSLSRNADIGK